jgi:preprotein translocase subunit SecA
MFIVSNIFKLIFGSRNQRLIKRLSKYVVKINALEPEYEKLSDDELRAKTDEFKERLKNGVKLDDLLVEAFAVAREASKRALGLRPFDVQLIGGMVLHMGKIAEMKTGEGKTLVATLPVYLNALEGKGVHVITVNDYLAKRDAEWMKPIYTLLGLTVDVNLNDMETEAKRKAYAADVTYGTNNEFGFDYLRDNMAYGLEDKVQRELRYAIIDEVDSILIDEARTPLIISGPSEDSSDLYVKIDKLIPHLIERKEKEGSGDFFLEEKHKQAFLTEDGHKHIEELLYKDGVLKVGESLYDPNNIGIMHHLNSALRANKLYQKDIDYIVAGGEVIIVDEHTGRKMPGRRWSDGLHQAVEAKEKVKIQNENQTLATITFQNYFRLYNKLSGMTGTADTEAYEFQQIYGLEVIVIPTNEPMIRKDNPDKVFLSANEKFKAVINDIKDCVTRGQPALVGTASIDTSEQLSYLLNKEKVAHQVLNAKHHANEAKIIVQAGRPGTITIATNMAGRGTDIVLGGNVEAEIIEMGDISEEKKQKLKAEWQERHDKVIAAGGLHVIGSERNESRRIDNQLRGRSGRQGDSGSSRYYVSLEDNLMRIFAADRVASIMKRLGLKEGEAIEHPWVSKAIENAQRKVEGFHFDVRKQLLEFDNVANDQRKVIYSQRSELMGLENVSETVDIIRKDVVNNLVNQYMPPDSMEEQWDVATLQNQLKADFLIDLDLVDMLEQKADMDNESVKTLVLEELEKDFRAKESLAGSELMRQFEKSITLQMLDKHWREHLATMDHLRSSIHLMGYAQKDPKQEYKKESFNLFSNMLQNIKFEVMQTLSTVQIQAPEAVAAVEEERRRQTEAQKMYYQHEDPLAARDESMQDEIIDDAPTTRIETYRREGKKVGRNEPCPCGSGKKYKNCCGRL